MSPLSPIRRLFRRPCAAGRRSRGRRGTRTTPPSGHAPRRSSEA